MEERGRERGIVYNLNQFGYLQYYYDNNKNNTTTEEEKEEKEINH